MHVLHVFLFLALITIGHSNADQPIVTMKLGQIQGTRKSVYGHSVEEFLGIRYGKIPKRFQFSVVDNDPWDGVFNATQYGRACTQVPIEGTSEDCLSINIWRPVTNHSLTGSFPVLLWVHGSGFRRGSGAQNPGDIIAASGPVIVVTINYRLGAFGFAFGDNDEIQGNQGISDVITALHWTRDNICYFGGDPARVTLGGHSAGSMIGSIFPVLPTIDHSLYSRLFLLSGVSVNPMFIEDSTVASAKTKLLAYKVGCNPTPDGSLTNQVIACLRTIEASNIINVNQDDDIKIIGGAEAAAFLPIYGTQLIPKPLMELFWSSFNSTGHRVTLISVTGKDESATFWGYLKPKTRAEGWKMAWDKLSFVKKDLTEAEMKPFYDHYFNATIDVDEKALRTALTNFMNDYSFRCSSLTLSEVYSHLHSIHFGEFDYIIDKYGPEQRPDGPWHPDDVEMYFGEPLRAVNQNFKYIGAGTYSIRDAETSARLVRSLISFVSGDSLNDWPELHFDRLKPEVKPMIREIDYKDIDVEYNKQSICVQWSKLLGFDVTKN